jgi:hypothetical protein
VSRVIWIAQPPDMLSTFVAACVVTRARAPAWTLTEIVW